MFPMTMDITHCPHCLIRAGTFGVVVLVGEEGTEKRVCFHCKKEVLPHEELRMEHLVMITIRTLSIIANDALKRAAYACHMSERKEEQNV